MNKKIIVAIGCFSLLLFSSVAVADWAEVSFGGTVTINDAGGESTSTWAEISFGGTVTINEANQPPVNNNPTPSDSATGVSKPVTTYSIDVSDPEGDSLDVYLYSNHTTSGNWFSWKNITGTNNGTKTWIGSHDAYGDFLGMGSGDLNYGTTYYWSVNTTDSYGNWDNDTYSFTTGVEPPNPSISIEKIANISSVEAGNTSAKVNYTIWVNNTGNVDFDWVLINDTKFNCECHDFYELAGGWETNASETTGFTLTHDTCWRTFNYTSALNASDSLVFWYNKTIYNCTGVTEGYVTNIANVTVNDSLATDTDMVTIAWGNVDNDPPEITSISPSNSSTGVSISLSALSFDLADPDGNLMNYEITTNISGSWGVLQAADGVSNGTKSASLAALTPLNYSTTYGWNITATDGVESNTTRLSFTTAAEGSGDDDDGGGGGGGFIPPNPDDTDDTDTPDDTPSTPGFEVITLFIGISILIGIARSNRKKRGKQ